AGEAPRARIVAHSLGGIVVRWALRDPNFARLLDKVVFLGTPHQGGLFALPIAWSLFDFTRNKKLLEKLRDEPLPGKIKYFNLRGSMDFVTPKKSTFLPHVPNIRFDGVGHAGLLSNSL